MLLADRDIPYYDGQIAICPYPVVWWDRIFFVHFALFVCFVEKNAPLVQKLSLL